MDISPTDFGASFKGFMEQMSASAPVKEPVFRQKIMDHFECDPKELPCITENFPTHDHGNLQVAVDAEFDTADYEVTMIGVTNPVTYTSVTLSTLVAPASASRPEATAVEGPVDYVNIKLNDDRMLPCVQSGLFLAKRGDAVFAVLMTGAKRDFRPDSSISIQVMSTSRERAEEFLKGIRTSMRKQNIYRGHVLSLAESHMGDLSVKFHRLPDIARDDIILPQGLLERVERETVRFSELAVQMKAAGRHLKRGILLHGPPGTGKTLTAMYVARAMKERTVLLLTGLGHRLLEKSCEMARMLQPSVLILEDVDLIAESRTNLLNGCASPLLFELLNQMDGLSDDADVLFLLTTNRPEVLESALSARPGRVDQAIEVALPDALCRRRLLELYGAGIASPNVALDKFVERTEGASASFIRELMRKATMFALDGASEKVHDEHLDAALHELVVEGGLLTQKVLGFGATT